MKKIKRIGLYIVIAIFSVSGTYIGFVIYNFYNVAARAILGLAVLYFFVQYVIGNSKNKNWVLVNLDDFNLLSLITGLISSFFISVVISLSLLAIVNLLRWTTGYL
ncbi:MAG: hypothetical protein KJZ77_00080 [Anaerolineales bacterium]|nr:hypothetical protein [Anaerolineales bacterium]